MLHCIKKSSNAYFIIATGNGASSVIAPGNIASFHRKGASSVIAPGNGASFNRKGASSVIATGNGASFS